MLLWRIHLVRIGYLDECDCGECDSPLRGIKFIGLSFGWIVLINIAFVNYLG